MLLLHVDPIWPDNYAFNDEKSTTSATVLYHGYVLPVADAGCRMQVVTGQHVVFYACRYELSPRTCREPGTIIISRYPNGSGLLFTSTFGLMSFEMEVVAVANSFRRLVSVQDYQR